MLIPWLNVLALLLPSTDVPLPPLGVDPPAGEVQIEPPGVGKAGPENSTVSPGEGKDFVILIEDAGSPGGPELQPTVPAIQTNEPALPETP